MAEGGGGPLEETEQVAGEVAEGRSGPKEQGGSERAIWEEDYQNERKD